MRPRRSSRGSSHEREQRLHELPGIERERLIQAFLRPPLRHTRYREGHGTLYTAWELNTSIHGFQRSATQSADCIAYNLNEPLLHVCLKVINV